MLDSLETDTDAIAAANLTARPFPDRMTLNEWIVESVSRWPDRPAVRCEGDPFLAMPFLSYREWDHRAGLVADRLRGLGVGPGSIVGLLVNRSYAMLIGLWAVLKAGAAYLPLSPGDPADRLAYVVRDAGIAALLTQASTAARAPAGAPTLNLEDPALHAGLPSNEPAGNHPDDLAYVIYTSGSTGRPKGVMIEHRAIVNRLHWMQSAYPLGPDDVLLQKTSYSFDVSVWELFWWALAGASVALLRPGGEKVPGMIVETVRRERVTMMHFVPSMLSVFLEYLSAKPAAADSLGTLRRVFTSGEALAPAHVERFNAALGGPRGCPLTNLYGPTEATVDATYYDCPAEGPIKRVPIGRPIQNLRAHILRDGRTVPPGESGELCLAGVGLARGYLNNPEMTAQRFVPHPELPGERIYRTGDVARWLPDGCIEYLGREDHQVKIRGLRIELGEIENTVRGFPGVTDCVVVVKKYSESIILLIAYVAAAAPPDWNALRAHLTSRLPEYMVPSHFELLAAIPLTPSGKADRKALPEPALGRKPA